MPSTNLNLLVLLCSTFAHEFLFRLGESPLLGAGWPRCPCCRHCAARGAYKRSTRTTSNNQATASSYVGVYTGVQPPSLALQLALSATARMFSFVSCLDRVASLALGLAGCHSLPISSILCLFHHRCTSPKDAISALPVDANCSSLFS